MDDAALLNLVLFLPLIGVVLLAAVPPRDEDRMRWVSLGVMTVQFVITAWLYARFDATTAGLQFATRLPWIPDWGVYYHIGLDGMKAGSCTYRIFKLQKKRP